MKKVTIPCPAGRCASYNLLQRNGLPETSRACREPQVRDCASAERRLRFSRREFPRIGKSTLGTRVERWLTRKKSVADILAAARKADAQGGAAEAPQRRSCAEKRQPKLRQRCCRRSQLHQPPRSRRGGARPSVAEMLAMARGEKQAAQHRPRRKKSRPRNRRLRPPRQRRQRKKRPPAKAEPVDTQSILAAARKGAKPGPMTKAEAAAKASPAAPDAKKAKAKEAIVVPPMPVKPAYAKPARRRRAKEASRRAARVHLRHVGAGDRLHGAGGDGRRLDARHRAVHVPEHSARAAQPVHASARPTSFRPARSRSDSRRNSACGS